MKKHICLTEDDPDDHFLFSKTLEEIDSDIKLTWFTTCEGLLKYLQNGTELPDVIVMDMNMPKMNGQACLDTIKNEVSLLHIPVIMMSTANSPTAIQTAYDGGAIRYYTKPFSLDEFKKVIREILTI